MSKIHPRFDTTLLPIVHDGTIPHVNSLGLRIAGSLAKAAGHVFHALRPDWRATLPAETPPEKPESPEEGGIPRIVWQTNFTDRCTWPMWRNVRHNRAMAKEFSFRFWDDATCDAYMREHAGSRTAAAYVRLTNGAAKADLWRLQVLHDFGGVYLDMDGTLVAPLAPLLRGRRELLVADDIRFTQYFMATVPRNPLFKEFIDTVVENVEHYDFAAARPVFWTTGPAALEKVLLRHPEVKFAPRRDVCRQGVYTNEHFQYLDRPRAKWTHNPSFVKPAE
jgi:mannosyltransferase OCH1-like enzyme